MTTNWISITRKSFTKKNKNDVPHAIKIRSELIKRAKNDKNNKRLSRGFHVERVGRRRPKILRTPLGATILGDWPRVACWLVALVGRCHPAGPHDVCLVTYFCGGCVSSSIFFRALLSVMWWLNECVRYMVDYMLPSEYSIEWINMSVYIYIAVCFVSLMCFGEWCVVE